ncbi:hypothetical protein MSZK_57260 [Mycobacterium sp. shizuoka-1]|nr:hypothetical protein MSZK_57260 [Mycobacterium sp. shizuoka-1]
MAVLRHRAAVFGGRGQHITVVDGHPVEVLGQHPGGAQPRDAGADDNCVFPMRGSPGAYHADRVPCCNTG